MQLVERWKIGRAPSGNLKPHTRTHTYQPVPPEALWDIGTAAPHPPHFSCSPPPKSIKKLQLLEETPTSSTFLKDFPYRE